MLNLDRIDDSGWLQSRFVLSPPRKTNFPIGKIKSRRGRPAKDDAFVYVTIGLRPAHWAWLKLWFPGGNPSDQLRALLDRALKFWPSGPVRFR